MANGDEAANTILKNLDAEIQGLIDDPAKSTKELVRGVLHVMKSQNPFLLQSLADHARTMRMWQTYRVMAWAMSALGLLIITLLWGLLTGNVELMFK